MDYDLVRKLKDMGFPQYEYSRGYYLSPDGTQASSGEDGCYVPIIEELIEACGKDTIKLWINGLGKGSGVQLPKQGLDDVIWYDTPTEAVAALYLAIHGKSME